MIRQGLLGGNQLNIRETIEHDRKNLEYGRMEVIGFVN